MLHRWTPTARQFRGRVTLACSSVILVAAPLSLAPGPPLAGPAAIASLSADGPAAARPESGGLVAGRGGVPAAATSFARLAGRPDGRHALAVPATPQSRPTPPAPPAPPAAPAPPVLPREGVMGRVGEGTGSWWAYIRRDRVTAHGSEDDPRISALRQSGPVFWFVRDNREYVVRDAATLREVEAIVAPVEALGAQQRAESPAPASGEREAASRRLEDAGAKMEREIADLIAKVLADGRARLQPEK